MNTLESHITGNSSILRKLRDVEVEEVLNTLEEEVEKYLRKVLPPKTDYSLTISFVRRPECADVIIDLTVKGNIIYSEDIDRVVSEAVKYAREKLVELLERKTDRAINTGFLKA